MCGNQVGGSSRKIPPELPALSPLFHPISAAGSSSRVGSSSRFSEAACSSGISSLSRVATDDRWGAVNAGSRFSTEDGSAVAAPSKVSEAGCSWSSAGSSPVSAGGVISSGDGSGWASQSRTAELNCSWVRFTASASRVPGQIRSAEIRFHQVGSLDHRLPNPGLSQVGPIQVGLTEIPLH